MEDVTAILGPVNIIIDASFEDTCALRVDAESGTYDVNLRIEDAFADLQSIMRSVPGGEDVLIDGHDAYWGDALPVLWVEADHLYAVQLMNSSLEPTEVRRVAIELARVLLNAD